MKKLISLVAIAAMMLAMAGCAVNATTGSIVVTNSSDKDAKNLKVGTVTIGSVPKGASRTVYFYKNEDAAEIKAEGFTNYSTTTRQDKINLKVNYLYNFSLSNKASDSSYVFSISGNELGGTNREYTLDK